ncbi:uncharacterized protein LOC135383458 [Ornithodoros turicata]|uniref:uncharacterized protein LOC135383458 n=1 Tax=Ornithodoros turicata TaxID=34597 RepID=UPI00313A02BF
MGLIYFVAGLVAALYALPYGECCDPRPTNDTSCIKVVIPNVFGLGTCLAGKFNTCVSSSDGIINQVLLLLKCVLQGLLYLLENGELTLSDVVSSVLNIVAALLDKLGVKELLSQLTGLGCGVKKLVDGLSSGVFGRSDVLEARLLTDLCKSLPTPAYVRCDKHSVNLTLPSALKAGDCLGKTLNLCSDQPKLLSGLVDGVICIVKNLSPQSLGGLVNTLLCQVYSFLYRLLGGGSGAGLKDLSGLLFGLLNELANCPAETC